MKLNNTLTLLLHKLLFPILALSLFFLFSFESCKSPTAPKTNSPDTTSNNFVWSVDTIGAEGSVLNDVTIINDTLAYVVGILYDRDSTGKSDLSNPYNAAIWNGIKWTKIKIPYDYQGQKIFGTIYSIFATNPNDIWFGYGNLVHWDGKQYSEPIIIPWFQSQANKIWESIDRNDLYVVGNNGLIAYSSDQGNSWTQVSVNTTLPFQDIWGGTDRIGRQQVLAVASDKFGNGGKAIISLDNGEASSVSDSGYISSLSGIWFVPNETYYIVGPGIFQRNFIQDNEMWSGPALPIDWYSFAIRGNNKNDVVAVGDAGSISHFNGVSWYGYTQLLNPIDRLVSVSMKNNLIIAVGDRHNDGVHYYGLIYIGKR